MNPGVLSLNQVIFKLPHWANVAKMYSPHCKHDVKLRLIKINIKIKIQSNKNF